MNLPLVPCRARVVFAGILAVLLMNLTNSARADEPAAGTPLEKARAAVEKTEAEKAGAEKTAADAAAAAQQAAAEEAAARTEAEKAEATKKAAEEAVAQAMAAAQAAAERAAAAKAAAEKAAAAQAEAEKQRAEKVAAAEAARRQVLAETALAAKKALALARSDLSAAQTALTAKTTAAGQAQSAVPATQQTAAAAAAEHAAAEKLLAEKTAAAVAAQQQATAEQDAAAAEPLRQAAAGAETERAAAEKTAAEKTAAAKAAADAAAAAQAAADKAASEEASARQNLASKTAAVPQALDAQATAEATAMGGLPPIPAAAWDRDKARHLLLRAGFGGPPAEVEKLCQLGLHAAVDHLVDYHQQPACALLYDVRPLERPLGYEAHLDQTERNDLSNERTQRQWAQQPLLRQWWLRRMAETPRPLEEKLVLFWHDHFATGYEDKLYNTHILYRQNEHFRRYADQFDGLLRGIIHDSAMIVYLDNQQNIKGKGNENLGREVLELFSLGRDQGYSENDLRELARALTGYSYVPHLNMFRFNGSQFDETPKTILGRTGNFSGDEAIDIILEHPSTARYVAKKLFEFFVHHQPSEETIDKLATVLRSNNYDLAPMLRNLFLSEEFYSERSLAQHIKSPIELMIGSIRMLQVPDVNYGYVDSQVQAMGQLLFQPPNVAGWEEGRLWLSANRIMIRYNGVADLIEKPNVDVLAAMSSGPASAAELVDLLARACLTTGLTESQRQEMIGFLGQLPAAAEWDAQKDQINAKLRALIVLIMSTPQYQMS